MPKSRARKKKAKLVRVEIVTSVFGLPVVREQINPGTNVSISKESSYKPLVNLSNRTVQRSGDSYLILEPEPGDLAGANYIGGEINEAGLRIYDQDTVLPGITKKIEFKPI